MPASEIGEMREWLTIQTRTETTDTEGGTSVVWSTLATVWGALVPVSTSERVQAQALQAQVVTRFRIRARSDVTAEMRVSWRPSWWPVAVTVKSLEIHGVLPDPNEPTVYLWLDCGEVP